MVPIAQFVQSERGLTWKHPVSVTFLASSKFNAMIAAKSAPNAKATDSQQALFDAIRAIGVASGTVDLAKTAQQFAQADIVGLYIDTDRTVYVRGDILTPYVRTVLAHELTHALQDQYFDLQRLKSGHADDDSAVTALIEGDAVRVQNAYERALSASDQKLLVQEQQQTAGHATKQNTQNGTPAFFVDQALFPYDFGPTFIAALLRQGGNSAVDEAFRHPPTLDGQIISPNTYTPGGTAGAVTPPPLPAGAQSIQRPGGFGEMTLLEMLGDQIGFNAAWPAVQGWMQDKYIAYRQHGQICVDVAVLNDSPTDAAALASAGTAWAQHLSGASVNQANTTVDFHACDPGPNWKPTSHHDDPYQALAVRSVATYQLITDAHLNTTMATCAADQLLTTMGPQNLEKAEQTTDLTSPLAKQFTAAVVNAVHGCA